VHSNREGEEACLFWGAVIWRGMAMREGRGRGNATRCSAGSSGNDQAGTLPVPQSG